MLWENKKRKGAHSNNIAHLQLIAVYPKQILEKRDQLTVFYLGDKFVCTHWVIVHSGFRPNSRALLYQTCTKKLFAVSYFYCLFAFTVKPC